ncbi:MAG: hypothetical protein HPY68_09140 [Candidatus Atribacteria bacterium]|nr:hypothetical protein [Candidatus Atribacteria bacterium]
MFVDSDRYVFVEGRNFSIIEYRKEYLRERFVGLECAMFENTQRPNDRLVGCAFLPQIVQLVMPVPPHLANLSQFVEYVQAKQEETRKSLWRTMTLIAEETTTPLTEKFQVVERMYKESLEPIVRVYQPYIAIRRRTIWDVDRELLGSRSVLVNYKLIVGLSYRQRKSKYPILDPWCTFDASRVNRALFEDTLIDFSWDSNWRRNRSAKWCVIPRIRSKEPETLRWTIVTVFSPVKTEDIPYIIGAFLYYGSDEDYRTKLKTVLPDVESYLVFGRMKG